MSGSVVLPGPATHTYYEVPPILRSLPGLNVPGKFRAELSMAFSKVYHLKPHALVLSYLEGRPLVDYFDEEAYALSHSYYQDPLTPSLDSLKTREAVKTCRRLFDKGQQPSLNDHTNW